MLYKYFSNKSKHISLNLIIFLFSTCEMFKNITFQIAVLTNFYGFAF